MRPRIHPMLEPLRRNDLNKSQHHKLSNFDGGYLRIGNVTLSIVPKTEDGELYWDIEQDEMIDEGDVVDFLNKIYSKFPQDPDGVDMTFEQAINYPGYVIVLDESGKNSKDGITYADGSFNQWLIPKYDPNVVNKNYVISVGEYVPCIRLMQPDQIVTLYKKRN
jgi:hypothetical protein